MIQSWTVVCNLGIHSKVTTAKSSTTYIKDTYVIWVSHSLASFVIATFVILETSRVYKNHNNSNLYSLKFSRANNILAWPTRINKNLLDTFIVDFIFLKLHLSNLMFHIKNTYSTRQITKIAETKGAKRTLEEMICRDPNLFGQS